jgi:predicted PurR-regulated permease PerM
VVAAGVAWRLLLLIVVGLLLGLIALRLRLVVLPFLLAVALAAILGGQANSLAKVLPRSLAALLVTLSATVLLGSSVFLVVRAVTDQWDELVASTALGIDEVQDLLAQVGLDRSQLEDLQLQAVSGAAGQPGADHRRAAVRRRHRGRARHRDCC